jgi:hypothetical protein
MVIRHSDTALMPARDQCPRISVLERIPPNKHEKTPEFTETTAVAACS